MCRAFIHTSSAAAIAAAIAPHDTRIFHIHTTDTPMNSSLPSMDCAPAHAERCASGGRAISERRDAKVSNGFSRSDVVSSSRVELPKRVCGKSAQSADKTTSAFSSADFPLHWSPQTAEGNLRNLRTKTFMSLPRNIPAEKLTSRLHSPHIAAATFWKSGEVILPQPAPTFFRALKNHVLHKVSVDSRNPKSKRPRSNDQHDAAFRNHDTLPLLRIALECRAAGRQGGILIILEKVGRFVSSRGWFQSRQALRRTPDFAGIRATLEIP